MCYTVLANKNLSDNGKSTDNTPSLISKVFPIINDFSAFDLQDPGILLGQQPVPLQGINHDHFDLEIKHSRVMKRQLSS